MSLSNLAFKEREKVQVVSGFSSFNMKFVMLEERIIFGFDEIFEIYFVSY